MRGYLRKRLMLPFPIDLRIIRASVGGEDEGGEAQEPWLAPLIAGDSRSVRAAAEAKQMAWIRAPKLGDDPTLHYCVAAYSSDFALLETSLLPHRQTIPSPQIQAASLDHSMWFHAPFRADEWLLYVMTSPAASGGRGVDLRAAVQSERDAGVHRRAGGIDTKAEHRARDETRVSVAVEAVTDSRRRGIGYANVSDTIDERQLSRASHRLFPPFFHAAGFSG